MGGDPKDATIPGHPTKIGVKPMARTTKPAKPVPCVHLGKPTGETKPCLTCTGNVRLRIYGCAEFSTCVITGDVGLHQCVTKAGERCPAYRGM